MAILNEGRIANYKGSSKINELKLYKNSVVSDNITLNSVNLPSPTKSASNNIVSNLGGFSRLITVNFILINDGTDRSTTSDSKITLDEQWDYLMENIIQEAGTGNKQREISYSITYSRFSSTKTIIGIVENISITPNEDSPTLLNGSITIRQGTNPFGE